MISEELLSVGRGWILVQVVGLLHFVLVIEMGEPLFVGVLVGDELLLLGASLLELESLDQLVVPLVFQEQSLLVR